MSHRNRATTAEITLLADQICTPLCSIKHQHAHWQCVCHAYPWLAGRWAMTDWLSRTPHCMIIIIKKKMYAWCVQDYSCRRYWPLAWLIKNVGIVLYLEISILETKWGGSTHTQRVCVLPWRPAKGSLRRFPAVLAAVNPGIVATLVVGKVRTARPPWPPMEPAILRGMSKGCPRDPVWAIIPVIRVAKLSWVST